MSDYTRLVARALVNAGDEVEVWAPEWDQCEEPEPNIRIHRLPGHFGPRALTILDRAIEGADHQRVLVQYVPHGFGLNAMNLPFCYWLYARRRLNITVMFHEVAFQRRTVQPIRHNLLGEITSLMAMLVVRSAQRVFVSSLAWEAMLRALGGGRKRIDWLPVPSNVPVVNDFSAIAAIKAKYGAGARLVGHFGTYGPKICAYLEAFLPQLLTAEGHSLILLGRGSVSFRGELVHRYPGLATKLHATEELSAEDLSRHLGACDLMIQPYPDGISARRTSAMAALAHGRAMLTTRGHLTESLWIESGAVATVPAENAAALVPLACRLLSNSSERERLGRSAAALYRDRFDVRHTINALRTTDAYCDSKLVQP